MNCSNNTGATTYKFLDYSNNIEFNNLDQDKSNNIRYNYCYDVNKNNYSIDYYNYNLPLFNGSMSDNSYYGSSSNSYSISNSSNNTSPLPSHSAHYYNDSQQYGQYSVTNSNYQSPYDYKYGYNYNFLPNNTESIVKESTPLTANTSSDSKQVYIDRASTPEYTVKDKQINKSKKEAKQSRNFLNELDSEIDKAFPKDKEPKRRLRTAFTTQQRYYLLSIFEKTLYPTREVLEEAAKQLNVSVSTLQTWFKNTRSKQKKLTNTKNL